MTASTQGRNRDGLGQLVLGLHVLGGTASRAELTERLGVGRSVMGYLLGELTDRGLVAIDRTGGPPPTVDGGRPSHRVVVADTAPTVIAAQLSADTVTVAMVGLGARIHQRVELPLSSQQAGDAVAELARLVARLAHGAPNLLGIGLAVPSPVRRDDGYAPAALHLGWPGVPLRDLLHDELARLHGLGALPLALGNDANLAAIAEYRHGAGQGAAQLLYLTTGHVGLGGGIVSDGRLFLGARGYAVEPGHITVDLAGAPCTCGSTGCLEIEVDHRGLLRAAGRPQPPLHEITGAVTALLDQVGDRAVDAAVAHVTGHLGVGLASLVNLTDPDRIVLGGTLGRLYRLRPDIVAERLASRSFLSGAGEIPVVVGALADSVLLGAAELAMQPLLDDPRRALESVTG